MYIVRLLLEFCEIHEFSTTVELSTSHGIWLMVEVLPCGVHRPSTGNFRDEINHQPWLISTGRKTVKLLVDFQLIGLNFKTLFRDD